MQRGAFSYITKPFKQDEILMAIAKALDFHRLKAENLFLRRELEGQVRSSLIYGSSPLMKEAYETIMQVAQTTVPVLISGEPGTGKELVARTIHYQSHRRENKFVAVNFSVIPDHLMESELFGQAKGYLPDVIWDKKGMVEEADQGTLFLEEVGNLNLLVQTKLIHLIQEGEYRPMGGQGQRTADIRFIAATREDLNEKVRRREFQEDLYYRLNVIQIVLPPLRERREDIPALARHFMEKYARINQKDIQGLAPEALDLLMGLEWPGNVRELENVIERGVILNKSGTLEIANLFPHPKPALQTPETDEGIYHLPFKEAKERTMSHFQQEYIRRALVRQGGVVSLAAKESGLERPYFHKLMRESRLNAKEFKPFKS